MAQNVDLRGNTLLVDGITSTGATSQGAVTATTVTASGAITATGVVNGSSAGVRTKQAVNNVHDTVPTKAELTTSFGDPATIGRGFVGTVDDADGDTNGYIVWASDANYYFIKGTKAS